jgi:hypothetical protein
MTKKEHTRGWGVADHVEALEKHLGGRVEIVVYNNKKPPERMLKTYAREGDTLTSWDVLPRRRTLIGANLMSRQRVLDKIGTAAKESSLVRHDAGRLADIIAKIAGVKK